MGDAAAGDRGTLVGTAIVALACTGCLAVPSPGGGAGADADPTGPDAAPNCAGLSPDRAAPDAHWPLDEASGTAARDATGEHDGVVLGSGTSGAPLWTTGQVGGALELDGADDRVVIADAPLFAPGSGDFSVAAWARTTADQEGAIVSRQRCASVGEHLWHLGMWGDGALYYRLGDGDELPIVTHYATRINDGAWHHVAAVFERDGDGTLFLDGAPVESASLASIGAIDGSREVHIGAVTDCGGIVPWRGAIDDVRYYERALAACEVAALAGGE